MVEEAKRKLGARSVNTLYCGGGRKLIFVKMAVFWAVAPCTLVQIYLY
jgi:hypothetical protein